MIKKLKVRNFRSLKDFEIEFGKFNVLVGKNASGKSNVLDCLNFLREVIETSLANAVEKRQIEHGYEDIVYGHDNNNIITIEREDEIKEKNILYHLSFSGKHGILKVEDAYLEIKDKKTSNKIRIKTSDIKTPLYPIIETSEQEEAREYAGLLKSLKKHISSTTFYTIDINTIKRDGRPSYESYTISPDGWNLVQVLDTLRWAEGEIYSSISKHFSHIYPGCEITLKPIKNVKFISIKETISGKEIITPSPYLSDGMIKTLFLLTTVFTTEFFKKEQDVEKPLFCFEEIENHLYPKDIWQIIEVLKSSEAQIILTTHSTYLLNHLEPEDVIILKKECDGTKAIKNVEKLRELTEKYELKLGELWALGEFDEE